MEITHICDLDMTGHEGYYSVVDSCMSEIATFNTYGEAEELLEKLMTDYRDEEYRIYSWGIMGGMA